MEYNAWCGFYGCLLDHGQTKIIRVLASNKNECCDHGREIEGFDENKVGICGYTDFPDVCACGCDASGYRCGL